MSPPAPPAPFSQNRYDTLAGLLQAYRTPVGLILVGLLVSLIVFFATLYGQSRAKEETFRRHANARLSELDAGLTALVVELGQLTAAANSGFQSDAVMQIFRTAQISVIRDMGIARTDGSVSAYNTPATEMVARALAPLMREAEPLQGVTVVPLANDRAGNLAFAAIQPLQPGSREYAFVVSDLDALISRTTTPGDPLWVVARIDNRTPAIIVSPEEAALPGLQAAQRGLSVLQESAPFVVQWEAVAPFSPIKAVLIPRRSFLMTIGPLPWLVLVFSLFATAAIGALSLMDARKAVEIQDEVERKTQALKQSHDIIAAKNEELARFAAHASHDLQAPLRAMRSVSTMLVEREVDLDERSLEMLERINRGAERAQNLVQDLLSYTRADRAEAKAVPIDADAVMRDVEEFLAGVIEETGSVLSWQITVPVYADPFLLTRALQNLVSNGIKYSKPDTTARIHVSARRDGKGTTLCVSDNGIGIKEVYFRKIFEVFERLHGADRYEGSGIGLALCKRVADLHGGRIWVESVADAGSRFYMHFPDPGALEETEAKSQVSQKKEPRRGRGARTGRPQKTPHTGRPDLL